ncbi:MAG: glycosyltransferase family 4 protein [Deltaproteobacteria bacterium]|nr:glycosyltransferase family 4 protein [Deltaproteobacteria bacterium]
MKVLELLASRHFTGPAEPILHLMSGLSARGHEVHFAHTQQPPGTLADKVPPVIVVHKDVRLERKGLVLPGQLADRRRLALAMAGDGRWIVHVHTSHDHWTGLLLKRRLGRRCVLIRSVHESRVAKRRLGDVPLFGAVDGTIAVSEAMKAKLVEAYDLPPERVAVVRGAVDHGMFRPNLPTEAILAEVDAAPGDPLIGIVSRIKPGRGHELLVEAFAPLASEFPNAKLLIVGRGEGKDALVAKVEAMGLEGQVRFLGYRRDDLPNILNAMRAKVLLGEGSDGTCRAALEAMACGTPVIASAVGSLKENIRDGETGTLVEPGNRDALTAAMRAYIEDSRLSETQGVAARARVESVFTVDAMVRQVEEFFQSTLDATS